jgi:hypothetical protein
LLGLSGVAEAVADRLAAGGRLAVGVVGVAGDQGLALDGERAHAAQLVGVIVGRRAALDLL